MKRTQAIKTALTNEFGTIRGTCRYLSCGRITNLNVVCENNALIMIGCDDCCESKIEEMQTTWPQFTCAHKAIVIRDAPLWMRETPEQELKEEYCSDCYSSEVIR